mgnify:CR=1 FL=1
MEHHQDEIILNSEQHCQLCLPAYKHPSQTIMKNPDILYKVDDIGQRIALFATDAGWNTTEKQLMRQIWWGMPTRLSIRSSITLFMTIWWQLYIHSKIRCSFQEWKHRLCWHQKMMSQFFNSDKRITNFFCKKNRNLSLGYVRKCKYLTSSAI